MANKAALSQYEKRKLRLQQQGKKTSNRGRKPGTKNKPKSTENVEEATHEERTLALLMVLEFGSKKEIAEAREEILGIAQALDTVLEEQK